MLYAVSNQVPPKQLPCSNVAGSEEDRGGQAEFFKDRERISVIITISVVESDDEPAFRPRALPLLADRQVSERDDVKIVPHELHLTKETVCSCTDYFLVERKG